MITRIYSPEKVLHLLPKNAKGFDIRDWNKGPNVILTNGLGDYTLFEYWSPGLYEGHFLYGKSRGNDAIVTSKQFLNEIFKIGNVIKGLTPVEHKGARWLSRRLGFKSYGIVNTINGEMELFILTKKEYINE